MGVLGGLCCLLVVCSVLIYDEHKTVNKAVKKKTNLRKASLFVFQIGSSLSYINLGDSYSSPAPCH